MELIQEQDTVLDQLFSVEQDREADSSPPPGGAKPRVTLREAIRLCWDKYTDFAGRSRRSEYWWFSLFAMVVILVPLVPLAFLCFNLDESASGYEVLWYLPTIILGIVVGVIILLLLFPVLAVTVRRLHDVGRSGKWLAWDIAMSFFSSMVLSVAHSNCNGLSASDEFSDVAMLRAVCESSLPLLVVAGVLLVYLSHVVLTLVIFYFTLLDSDKGKNKYGLSPKYQNIDNNVY